MNPESNLSELLYQEEKKLAKIRKFDKAWTFLSSFAVGSLVYDVYDLGRECLSSPGNEEVSLVCTALAGLIVILWGIINYKLEEHETESDSLLLAGLGFTSGILSSEPLSLSFIPSTLIVLPSIWGLISNNLKTINSQERIAALSAQIDQSINL